MTKSLFNIFACLVLAASLAQHAHATDNSAIPADAAKLAEDFSTAIESHDLDRVMKFYSKRYLHDGRDKKMQLSYLHLWVGKTPDYKLRLTSFKPISSNRAFITAEITSNGEVTNKKPNYQIVRENGKWRWLGNQLRKAEAIH